VRATLSVERGLGEVSAAGRAWRSDGATSSSTYGPRWFSHRRGPFFDVSVLDGLQCDEPKPTQLMPRSIERWIL